MPVRLFSDSERDSLNRFPPQISPADLTAYYTLTRADLSHIRELRGATNQLGFALQLCTLRYLGFCPDAVADAPSVIADYVAQQLKTEVGVLDDYGKRDQTRTEHLKRAQLLRGLKDVADADYTALLDWLTQRALEHDQPSVLFELLVTKLRHDKFVRPGVTPLERLVFAARDKAHAHTYAQLDTLLIPSVQTFLDRLLDFNADLKRTRLEWLRQPTLSNTPTAILSVLKKLTYLRENGVTGWDISSLTPNRRNFLMTLGKKTSAQALSKAAAERRYPILMAFAVGMIAELTDTAIEMFDAFLTHAYTRAGRELDQFRLSRAKATNEKVVLFHTLGEVILDGAVDDSGLRAAIYQKLSHDRLKVAVEESAKLMRPLDDNYFDLLAERFPMIRQFAPEFLDAFIFRSNPANAPLLEAVEILRKVNAEKRKLIPGYAPLAFVSGRWEPYVQEENGRINRKFYELCVLWELRQALRGGNVWVEGSRRYAKMESYLVEEKRWQEVRAEVHSLLDVPLDGGQRLKERGAELNRLLTQFNAELAPDKNGSGLVRLEDGELVLTPLSAAELPPHVAKLQHLVTERLPRVELVDLLIEVDRWTGFSQRFTHAATPMTTPTFTDDEQVLLYGAIIAQACNLGLTTLGRMTDLSRRSLAWWTNWHIREETLKDATAAVINDQHKRPLAAAWGDGTFSSSDGQRFAVTVQTRNAQALPRYFGYGRGLTFYSWTSDQSSQYASRVIPPTLRDATIVLDGILDNQTDLVIGEHTTDTAGYTELLFALFDLLGIAFSPRIRDLPDQHLYRYDRDRKYENIADILKGTIRQDLIVEHWDQIMRVVGSLKLGWVNASLLISKLQSFPRQNILTRVLQEYGKLCKTIFILRYLESEQYRRRIETQLNKGENLHALRQVLFFGQQGQIRRHHLEEQVNQASCLNLVTNCVVAWNTVYIEAVVEQLRKEGKSIADEDVSHLSPARSEHINVYGKYRFDLEAARQQQGLRPLRLPQTEDE